MARNMLRHEKALARLLLNGQRMIAKHRTVRTLVAEQDAGDAFRPHRRTGAEVMLQVIALTLLAMLVIVTSTYFIVS